ncbi:unnamed protein product, partial [marine sediment metagenome]
LKIQKYSFDEVAEFVNFLFDRFDPTNFVGDFLEKYLPSYTILLKLYLINSLYKWLNLLPGSTIDVDSIVPQAVSELPSLTTEAAQLIQEDSPKTEELQAKHDDLVIRIAELEETEADLRDHIKTLKEGGAGPVSTVNWRQSYDDSQYDIHQEYLKYTALAEEEFFTKENESIAFGLNKASLLMIENFTSIL